MIMEGHFHNNMTMKFNCTDLLSRIAGPPPAYSEAVAHTLAGLLSVFPIITVFGNMVVVLSVLTHKRLRTVTNAFIVSLAIADCLVAVAVMPFGIYQQYTNKEWHMGEFFCLLTISCDVLLTTISILHLSCLAMDRYLAICWPFYHERINRKSVCCTIIFCWIMPIFISFVPIMNKWNMIGVEDHMACIAPPDAPVCVFIVNAPFAVVCSLLAFYIPSLFMIVCNSQIYIVAKKQALQIRSLELAAAHHRAKGKHLRQETKAAKTLGIIMGCFCMCWCPFFILNIIDPFVGYRIHYIPWAVATWLGYIQSLMNPFLYYFFNRAFKKAFIRLLKFKVCRGVRDIENDMKVSATSNTSD